jgi:hypothetical protein
MDERLPDLPPAMSDRQRWAIHGMLLAACAGIYAVLVPCPRVMLLIATPFVPFCLGALIGHNIGRFHHPAHWDGIEMNFED